MESRGEIFKAAKKVFAEKGYNAASVREIAEEAKVSKPVIYYYFESKEKLYSEIISHIANQLENALQLALSNAQNLEQKLLNYGESFVEYFHQNKEELSIYLAELYQKKISSISSFAKLIEMLKNLLREKLSQEEADAVALSYLGFLNLLLLTEKGNKATILYRLHEMANLLHKLIS